MWTSQEILRVLDDCAGAFTFPALDNGYVYLAGTKLSAYRSAEDWALVIEIFGFSPRMGLPDLAVYTLGSTLRDRNTPAQYVSDNAYRAYLAQHPHDEVRSFYPIAEGSWLDDESCEYVAANASVLDLRGRSVPIPSVYVLEACGINPAEPPRIRTFELCRFLAETRRDLVMASSTERRTSVPAGLVEVLTLDAWHHPDVVANERPSASETFQLLACVLVTGDATVYQPSSPPNTHWSRWPDGGTL